MIGQTISYYRIIEKLGQGGMGEVYRTVDTKLDRQVAIKALPDTFSSDPEPVPGELLIRGTTPCDSRICYD